MITTAHTSVETAQAGEGSRPETDFLRASPSDRDVGPRQARRRLWTPEVTLSRKIFDLLLTGLVVAWLVALASSGSWLGQNRGLLLLASLLIGVPSLFSGRSAPPSAYRDPQARPAPHDPSFFRYVGPHRH